MFSDFVKASVAAIFLLCSCDIREDRADCPCYLTLDWSQVDSKTMLDGGYDTISWSVSAADGSWRQCGDNPLETLCPATEIEVPKDTVTVMALCGAAADPVNGVTVEEGQEYPRLYFYCRDIDATGMMARDTVTLHREHAGLFLYMRNVLQSGASYTVTGTVSGCSLSGQPVSGPFSVRVPVDGRGLGSVVIPRQVDGSLRLNVSYAGEVVRSLAIGEYILQSGYDWTAPDLEDIVMEIDYHQTKVVVSAEQWKKTLTFDVVF